MRAATLTLFALAMKLAPDGCSGDPHQLLPIERTFATPGPEAVATTTVGDAGGRYLLFSPVDLGAARHPILTWGNGSNAEPGQYSQLLTHLASWGFVVIASTSSATGSGLEMLAGVDWLVRADTDPKSPLYARLDTEHVGALGHSQGAGGSLAALEQANAPDSPHVPLTTIVPIGLPAQWLVCDAADCVERGYDARRITSGSVFFVGGSSDDLVSPPTQPADSAGQQSLTGFYDATPAGTPKARATLAGADHNDVQDHCFIGCTGVGPRGYFGYLTAWLRYRLAGDALARSAFAGDIREINGNSAWQHQAEHVLP